ncbi:MAG: hypothetical protein AB1Z98_26195 [Nannocystaceae bacterium]
MSTLRFTLVSCSLAATALVAMPGCDEAIADRGSTNVEFREVRKGCVNVNVAGSTGTFVYDIMPFDEVGGGGVPHGPLLERVVHNSNQVFALAFASGDVAEVCTAACIEEELDWSGRGCVVEGNYGIGEPMEYERADGTVGQRVDVEVDVIPGCACEG